MAMGDTEGDTKQVEGGVDGQAGVEAGGGVVERPKVGRRRRVIVPLTRELAEAEGKKVREEKRRAARRKAWAKPIRLPSIEHGQKVAEGVTAEDWEYIIRRVEGMPAMTAVIALADARGETISRNDAQARARDMERRLGVQIDQQIKNKVMSDEDFESWTRMKVEQLIATPGPNTQGVIRAIQYLKKAREEGKARNPEALMKLVIECANRIHELDRLEEEAVRRGQKKAEEPAPVSGEYGSQ